MSELVAQPAISTPNTRPSGMPALGWLRRHLRLVLGGGAAILLLAAGTLGRPWLEALGVGSAVLALLPCAAMCAAGLCMGGGQSSCAKGGGTSKEGPGASSPGKQESS